MKRWSQISCLFSLSLALGCASQSDLQAMRADLATLERDSLRRNQETSARLDTLDTRLGKPSVDTRRELAETGATMDELRVEVQRLQGQLEELQYSGQGQFGATGELGDIFATKLAEMETRLAAIEQQVDPEGSAARRQQLKARETATTPPTIVVPAPSTTQPVASKPPAQPSTTTPTTRPSASSPSAQPITSSERLYERALQEYKTKNYEVAIVLFKQFLRQYPDESLAGHAQYWLGESLYAQQQYEAAIVAFDEVVQKYSGDSKVPAAILKQGYAFAALNDERNARFFLQQVQKQYPDSPEARQAAERLKKLQ